MVITPTVQLGIFGVAAVAVWGLSGIWTLSAGLSLGVFWLLQTAVTLLVLRAIRFLVPLRPGAYLFERHIGALYAWNLVAYLSITNLSWVYLSSLLAPPFRSLLYRLLGAKFGPGIIPIAGRMDDPWLMEMEEETMLGAGALMLGHALTPNSVILGRVVVKRGAVIGANSVVMPNVIVGEHAMVNALSYVPMNTKIGAYEVWGGNPARKLRDLPKPPCTRSEESS